MNKLLFLLSSILIATYVNAQIDDPQEIKHLEQQGKLFTVQIIPRAKSLDVFVVGYKSGGLKFNDLGMEAFANIGGKKVQLKVSKENDHFKIERSVKDAHGVDLQLIEKTKVDTLHFDIP